MDPIIKLKSILDSRSDEYAAAYKSAFEQEFAPPTGDFTDWIIEFFKQTWKFDFLPYSLDSFHEPEEKGKELLRYILEAYADEMEDVQAEAGTSLRHSAKLLQAFSPKLDFLNEIGPDCYARRPLDRLWQMEPMAIFGDMSVCEDAEADALLDTLEKNFTPMIPDVASTADRIRKNWFSWLKTEDEDDEVIFYETVERAVTHAVATEGRLAATDWIFRNFDGNALLIGLLFLCTKGLECLTMFCSNYKFISGNRILIENLMRDEG